jgi:hypothetical protein
MHITLTVKSEAYRYLWLKSVQDFNPSVHCARCLVGTYAKLLPFRADRKIPAGLEAAADLDPTVAPYFYLCGVTSRYAENLHIAFAPEPDSTIRYEDAHIRVVITGARQVPILPLPQAVIDAQRLTKPFASCRNYQFGWQMFAAQDTTEGRP